MFNQGFSGYSLADVAAATGANRNNDGFCGDGASWWIIILFLFAFCGWGGNGFGGRGDAALQGALTRADLSEEMNSQETQNAVRSVANGLSDGFYSQNSTMLQGFSGLQGTINNGFSGVDRAICTLGYQTQQGFNDTQRAIGSEFRGLDNAICNLGYQVQQTANTGQIQAMQNANALQAQIAQCCCDQRAGLADIKYQMATDACAINTHMQNQTRDIIDNANANTRSILDFLVQDKISTLEAENQALRLSASQERQNSYLVSTLRPTPIPAYNAPSPFQTYGCGCGCGNNNGCGCF